MVPITHYFLFFNFVLNLLLLKQSVLTTDLSSTPTLTATNLLILSFACYRRLRHSVKPLKPQKINLHIGTVTVTTSLINRVGRLVGAVANKGGDTTPA